jgi:hypothetical protein
VLRALDIGAERVAEVLEEMGVLIDDRRPAFEGWLERKLDGLAPGISREVEAWQRVLHDGGPRIRARDRSTCSTYSWCHLPVLDLADVRHDCRCLGTTQMTVPRPA